jgi:hypothetical protein
MKAKFCSTTVLTLKEDNEFWLLVFYLSSLYVIHVKYYSTVKL